MLSIIYRNTNKLYCVYSVLHWILPTRVRMNMAHATWRTRAARSAGAPEEKLQLVSENSVEVRLYMDSLESLKLTLREIVSVRERDGYTVIQEQLILTCKACGKELYHTYEKVQLEDLSAARTNGQLHLSECKPASKAETPDDQASTADAPEQQGRTYCD
jgi:hypothetical protein